MKIVTILALLVATTAMAAEMLVNGNFESGPVPSGEEPLNWTRSTKDGDWGGARTATAAHGLGAGDWGYAPAGPGTGESWSGYFQNVACTEGQRFKLKGWIRSQSSWPTGSRACLKIEFWSSGSMLVTNETPSVTTASTAYAEYSIETDEAPVGTEKARVILFIYKPTTSSPAQTIANFDDVSLTLLNEACQPMLNPAIASIATSGTSTELALRNVGGGTANWTASSSLPWVSVTPGSGSLSSTPVPLTVTANKASITPNIYPATITVSMDNGTSAQSSLQIAVGPLTATGSSAVAISGYNLYINGQAAVIKGIGWITAVTSASQAAKREGMLQNYPADLKMAASLGANCVCTYADFGTDSRATELLDYASKLGLKIIVLIDGGNNDQDLIRSLIPKYKSHPAILGYQISVEGTINLFYNRYTSLDQTLTAMESACQLVKSLDSTHPVFLSIGDHDTITFRKIIEATPTASAYSVNSYRGKTFGTLFTDLKSMTSRPVMVGEFGNDSYDNNAFRERRDLQAEYAQSQLRDIAANLSIRGEGKNVIGACFFALRNGLEKCGNPSILDRGGFSTTAWNPAASWDSFMNEEHFGAYDSNCREKLIAAILREEYALWVPPETNKTPPSISSMTSSTAAAIIGETITFSASATGKEPLTYAWDFGDGQTSSGTTTVTHSYLASGTFTVSLVVTDVDGLSSTKKTLTVTISTSTSSANVGSFYSKVFFRNPKYPKDNVHFYLENLDFSVESNHPTLTVTIGTDRFVFENGALNTNFKKYRKNSYVFFYDNKISIRAMGCLTSLSNYGVKPGGLAEVEIPIQVEFSNGRTLFFTQKCKTYIKKKSATLFGQE